MGIAGCGSWCEATSAPRAKPVARLRAGRTRARQARKRACSFRSRAPPPPGSVPANALPVPRDRRAAVPRGFAGRSRRPGTARLPAGWVNGFRFVHSRHRTRRRNRKGVLRILTPGTEVAGSGDNVLSAQPVPLWGRASPGATGPREEGRGAGPGGSGHTHTPGDGDHLLRKRTGSGEVAAEPVTTATGRAPSTKPRCRPPAGCTPPPRGTSVTPGVNAGTAL